MLSWALIIEFFHILASIIWVGGATWMTFVVKPLLRKRLKADPNDPTPALILRRATPVFVVASFSTVALGVLRGTLFGPVTSWAVLFGTPYGLTWLAALTIALLTANLGGTGRFTEKRISARDVTWLDHGPLTATFEWIELVAFLMILGCMVLMKVGL